MAAGRYASRVFAMGRALHSKLDAAVIPANDTTGEEPPVYFSDENPDAVNESVTVALNVDPTGTEWRRLSPPGRDERITFDVTFRTVVPGVENSSDVWDRLEAVAAVIEGVAFDTTAETSVLLGFDGEVWTKVDTPQPFVWPTAEGWQGAVRVSFESFCNI